MPAIDSNSRKELAVILVHVLLVILVLDATLDTVDMKLFPGNYKQCRLWVSLFTIWSWWLT